MHSMASPLFLPRKVKIVAVTKGAAPLLDTPHFDQVFGGKDGNSLPLDEQKLLRPVSLIAFPGTKVELIEQHSEFIYRIQGKEYPDYLGPLYTDIRLLEQVDSSFPERSAVLPPKEKILEQLASFLGASYVWGGNWRAGIPAMRELYPPKMAFNVLDPLLQTTWLLHGVDCSGLLYEVAQGLTPRNTAQLVDYGQPVPVAGKTAQEIRKILRPLDLIVWKGHIVLVFDTHQTIESRLGKGVFQAPLDTFLSELMQTRTPVDDWGTTENIEKRFVVRRWLS